MVIKGEEWGEGIVRELVCQYALTYLKCNHQGPTVELMELYSMLCGSLDGREVWGRMHMAESLHCLPETIITLFVNQLYPNTK